MPIYEYQCTKCHKVFEEWHKHIDEDVCHPCPECHGEAERIVSNTTFVLKGGGWYVTDYGNRKNDPAPSKEASSAAPAKESSASTSCTASG